MKNAARIFWSQKSNWSISVCAHTKTINDHKRPPKLQISGALTETQKVSPLLRGGSDTVLILTESTC